MVRNVFNRQSTVLSTSVVIFEVVWDSAYVGAR